MSLKGDVTVMQTCKNTDTLPLTLCLSLCPSLHTVYSHLSSTARCLRTVWMSLWLIWQSPTKTSQGHLPGTPCIGSHPATLPDASPSPLTPPPTRASSPWLRLVLRQFACRHQQWFHTSRVKHWAKTVPIETKLVNSHGRLFISDKHLLL